MLDNSLTLLGKAAEEGDTELVFKYINEFKSVFSKTQLLQHSLLWAAKGGQNFIVQKLIDSGANIKAPEIS